MAYKYKSALFVCLYTLCTGDAGPVSPTKYWIRELHLTDKDRRGISSGKALTDVHINAAQKVLSQHAVSECSWSAIKLLVTRQSLCEGSFTKYLDTQHWMLSLGDNNIHPVTTLLPCKTLRQ